MKRYILTLLAALFLLVNGVYAQTTSYDSKKGDLGISVTFNPASLAYSMSCQPAPGDFAGEYISDLAGNPKQMFILAQAGSFRSSYPGARIRTGMKILLLF